MSKTKKSLVISIFTLVMAVAIATTSTFAWFAMTETPSVEEFELTVTTQDGLYISADRDSGYKMDLAATSLQTQKNFDFVRLTAATAMIADTYLKDAGGTITVVADATDAEEMTATDIKLADANARIAEGSDAIVVGDKVSVVKVYGYFDGSNVLQKGLFFESLNGTVVPADYTFGDAIVAQPNDWADAYYINYVERTGTVGSYTYSAIAKGESAPAFVADKYCKIVFAGLYQFDVHFISNAPYSIFMDDSADITNVTTKTQSDKTIKSPRNVVAGDLVGADNTLAEVTAGDNIDALAANAMRIGVAGSANTVVFNPNSTKGWSTITNFNMAHEWYDSMAIESKKLTAAQKTESGSVLTALDYLADGACILTTLTKVLNTDALYDYFGDGSDVYYGSVTVSLWLEGKDADCFDSIYEDIMKINIGFAGVNFLA